MTRAGLADYATCTICGHRDVISEFYHLERDAKKQTYGQGMACRNHNMCHARKKAEYARNFNKPKKENTMEFATYTQPETSEGDTYKPREHYGCSAIVHVIEYKPEIITSNSPNGAPGVIVNVYDLNLKKAFTNVLLMTGALVDGFKNHAGGPPVVVKWEKAVARNGRDYATATPAAEAAITAAKDVYANNPDPFLTQSADDAEPPF